MFGGGAEGPINHPLAPSLGCAIIVQICEVPAVRKTKSCFYKMNILWGSGPPFNSSPSILLFTCKWDSLDDKIVTSDLPVPLRLFQDPWDMPACVQVRTAGEETSEKASRWIWNSSRSCRLG